jgi:flagellar P-ring protein precursor FlgI
MVGAGLRKDSAFLMKNILLFSLLILSASFSYGERLKDITRVKGIRENQLVGYGLVVGLAGNGDSTLAYTAQSFTSALKRFGINLDTSISSSNVAAVMVTANINPFVKEGSPLDVMVSSIGDAKTLQGGTLLQTPLVGADDTVYAVAQGPVIVGGFFAGASGEGGATVQKNHPTVGTINGGAIVERAIPVEIINEGSIDLLLRYPDSTSAVRLADAVNRVYPASAQAMDFGTVNIIVPDAFLEQPVNFVAALGEISVQPDSPARVVINERTGTIVATSDVRISNVAISYGSLMISVASQQNVSQPAPFSQTGETAVTPSTDTSAKETRGGFTVLPNYPTIERLAAGLNTLGVSTRDTISILQTLHAANALQAELVIN